MAGSEACWLLKSERACGNVELHELLILTYIQLAGSCFFWDWWIVIAFISVLTVRAHCIKVNVQADWRCRHFLSTGANFSSASGGDTVPSMRVPGCCPNFLFENYLQHVHLGSFLVNLFQNPDLSSSSFSRDANAAVNCADIVSRFDTWPKSYWDKNHTICSITVITSWCCIAVVRSTLCLKKLVIFGML